MIIPSCAGESVEECFQCDAENDRPEACITHKSPAVLSSQFQLKSLLLTVFVLSFFLFLPACRKSSQPAVVVYCAQDQVYAEPILAEFTRQTGIPIKPVFDSEAVKTVGLANRLLAERSHPICDVFWGNEELRTRQLAEAGVFESTNGWAAFGQRSRRLIINTNFINPNLALAANASQISTASQARQVAAPSFLELTNTQWRGKVALALPLFGTTATHFLALRQHWGVSNWLEWSSALMANRPFVEEGNSHVVRRVARGEAWVGLTDSDDILAGQREGMPVAALSTSAETLFIPNTIGLVAKPGQDRSLGRQVFDYLRSPTVQARLIEVGALETAVPTHSGLRPDWDGLLRELDPALAELRNSFSP